MKSQIRRRNIASIIDYNWLNSGGGGSYLPTDFPGLQWWYDASQLTGLDDNDPAMPITDYSGNGYNMSPSNPPTYKTNIVNGLPALLFNGTTNAASPGVRNANFLHEGDFTLIFVINPSSITETRYLIDTNGNSTTFKGVRVIIQNNGRVSLAIGNGTSNVVDMSTLNGAIPVNQTSIIVLKCEGNVYTIEVNNVLQATSNLVNARVSGDSIYVTLFFRQSNSALLYYSGYAAEWMAYNRALTETELNQLIGGLPYGL